MVNKTLKSIQVGNHTLEASEKVDIARHKDRPKGEEYITHLFTNFIELKGDRKFGNDDAIIGGIASFDGIPVTVIAQCKGTNLETNMNRNFGMPHPEGYRKAIRLAKQAEKFNRPIIFFVDTPGAYPGIGAEQRGQSEAIAQCLYEFSSIKVPIISIVIGEGGSGGALAFSIANRLAMLEHSIYSILSPEGFATILWKDVSRAKEATTLMKLTAQDLKAAKIIDSIIEEPKDGAHINKIGTIVAVKSYIQKELVDLVKVKPAVLVEERYKKFREIGNYE